MRVLLVHNYYKCAGGEDTVFHNEQEMLKNHNYTVFTYTRSNKEIDHYNFVSKLLLPINSVFSLRTYKDILNIIKQEKIDIVHVHNTLTLISPSIFVAAAKGKVPVVNTLHNFRMLCPGGLFYLNDHICEECLEKGLQCALKNKCYRNSFIQTAISALILKFHRMIGTYGKVNFICLTSFNRNKLLELNRRKYIIEEKNVYIKPNFTNEVDKIIPYSQRKNQVLFAGRLDHLKGIDKLIAIWKADDPKLIVCGTGNVSDKKKNYNNIEFLGQVTHEKMVELMSECKAVLIPSVWYEGLPMVMVESYACGTPVIGSNQGNVGLCIADGETGIRVSNWEKCNINQCLESFSQKTVNNCINYFWENYCEEKNYEMLMQIYLKIINS